jgi:NitT/TauT family transport system substrate-binding protein
LKTGGEEAKEAVAQALVDNMGWTSLDEAKAAMDRVKFLTMGDNLNLFGMNPEYKGVKGQELWSKFGKLFKASGDIQKAPPAWSDVFDRSIVVAVSKDLKGAIHKAEGRKEFTPVTDEIANEPALTRKSVTVNFATGSAVLDDENKNIIKREFGDAVQAYRDARIRVVGNTDNTGSAATNKALSLKRAQAVKAYLVSEYDSDPNRFIVIGNGPKQAIEDGVEGDSENYRRTDFELVQE